MIQCVYDVRDRPVEYLYPRLGRSFRHEWDRAGRLVKTLYSGGVADAYGYDSVERLTSV